MKRWTLFWSRSKIDPLIKDRNLESFCYTTQGKFVFNTKEILELVEEAEAEASKGKSKKGKTAKAITLEIEDEQEEGDEENISESESDCIIVASRR